MRALVGMMLKEFHQIRRDVRALGILLLFPTALLLFLGYVISMDVKHVPVAVFDEDRSDLSRQLVSHVTRTEHLDLVGHVDSSAQMERAVFDGRARIGIHIPRGFSRVLRSGGKIPVQAVIDGTNSLIASSASGVLRSFVYAYNLEVASSTPTAAPLSLSKGPAPLAAAPLAAAPLAAAPLAAAPLSLSKGRALPMPGLVVPRVRMYYNPELRSSFFLIPGIIAFILALANTLSTALSIVREKERGTIEQIVLSPLPSWKFIVGKTIPYVIISIVSAGLILAAGHFLFGVPMRGNPWMLGTSTLVYIVCTLSLGLLISSITSSQQVAFTVSVLATFLPTFLLSGFVFPIKNMPIWIQAFTYLVPARFYVRILRGTLLQDAHWEVLLPDLGLMAILGLALLLLATLRVRKGGLTS